MQVTWVHFPLHPETPADGMSLEAMFADRDIDLDAMYKRMKSLMDDEGLEYGKRTHTYNSRLAQELGAWADTLPQGDAFHQAMFEAYFISGDNIGDVDVLVGIAEQAGLPAEAARQVLQQRSFRDHVDADWQRSRAIGVTGVPTFVAGGYGVVGAQSYDVLANLLSQALAQR